MNLLGSLLKLAGAGLLIVANVATAGALQAVLTVAGLALVATGGYMDRPQLDLEKRSLAIRTRRDVGAPHPVVYGKAKLGTIAHDLRVHNTSYGNGVLFYPLTICHGSRDGLGIAKIREVYFDGRLGIDRDDGYVEPFDHEVISFFEFLGTADQNIGNTVIDGTTKICDFDGWSCTTDKGGGLAALVLELRERKPENDPDKPYAPCFPRGVPQVTVVVEGNFVEDPRSQVTGVNITFVEGGEDRDTIVRASGSFVTDGWVAGDRVKVTGSTSNNGSYTIYSVAALTLTLIEDDDLTDEGPVGGVTLARWAHPDNGGDNPALCIRDYLLSDIYGPGYTTSLLDEASFAAMADYYDEQVDDPDDTTEKRFRCNGWLNTDRTVGDNLKELLSSCRGHLVWQNGKFRLFTTRVVTPNADVELTDDNIIGSWRFTNAGIETKWNIVRATYLDGIRPHPEDGLPTFKPNQVQWPPVGDANTYLTEDGGFENRLELQLPLVNDAPQAQRIAQVTLNESRQGIMAECRCTEDALLLQVGEVVKVTHATPAWTDKTFWVMGLALLPDSTVNVALMEYDAAAYSLDTCDSRGSIPDTGLGDLFDPVAPTNVVCGDLGTTGPAIRVTWNAADYAFVDYYEVQAQNINEDPSAVWRTYGRVRGCEALTECLITGVRNGQTWKARVRTVNPIDRASAWVTSANHQANIHPIAEITATLDAVANGCEVNVSDYDSAAWVEVYIRENNASGGANPYENAAYHATTLLSGAGPFLEPAAANQWVKALLVPYNAFGERGTPHAILETESGAAGAGPSDPPSNLDCPPCTGCPAACVSDEPEDFDTTWTNGDATATTRVYLDGEVYSTKAAGVAAETVSDLESDTDYVVGLRHLKNGIFNPLESESAIELAIKTKKGTLGVPQNLATQTIDPYAVKLTWAIGTDGEEAYYEVWRSETDTWPGDFSKIKTTGVGVLTYTHESIDDATETWYFRVLAKRPKWTASDPTAAVQGTYGCAPRMDFALFVITSPECENGGCPVIPGCTESGTRHFVGWCHTGGDDTLHHIEIWQSVNGEEYTKEVDNLSVDEVPECAPHPHYDGGYALFFALCDNEEAEDTYQYKVELREDTGGALVDSATTVLRNQRGTTVCAQ